MGITTDPKNTFGRCEFLSEGDLGLVDEDPGIVAGAMLSAEQAVTSLFVHRVVVIDLAGEEVGGGGLIEG